MVSEYVRRVEGRLAADGCEPRWVEYGGRSLLVGRRSDFRVRWMLTRLHLFAIVSETPSITIDDIVDFGVQAVEYALEHTAGLPRGMQTGLAVFPTMVSNNVAPDAITWAKKGARTRFALMIRPVVVDLRTSTVATYRGLSAVGAVYSGHLRRKSEMYYPPV